MSETQPDYSEIEILRLTRISEKGESAKSGFSYSYPLLIFLPVIYIMRLLSRNTILVEECKIEISMCEDMPRYFIFMARISYCSRFRVLTASSES